MRLSQAAEVKVPQQEVWDYLADFTNYPKFVAGLSRWELADTQRSGLGARFRLLIHAGSADVGGLIEVVEWNEPWEIAFSSVTGIDQRGRWRLRPIGDRATRVEFRWAYGVAGGGISALIAERLAALQLRRDLKKTLAQLKGAVEQNRHGAGRRARNRAEAA